MTVEISREISDKSFYMNEPFHDIIDKFTIALLYVFPILYALY